MHDERRRDHPFHSSFIHHLVTSSSCLFLAFFDDPPLLLPPECLLDPLGDSPRPSPFFRPRRIFLFFLLFETVPAVQSLSLASSLSASLSDPSDFRELAIRLLATRELLRPIPMHFSKWGAKRDATMLRWQLGHRHSNCFLTGA